MAFCAASGRLVEVLVADLQLGQQIVEAAVIRALGDLRVEARQGLGWLLAGKIVGDQPAQGGNGVGVAIESLLQQRRALRIALLREAQIAQHQISLTGFAGPC
jgi:hypothetical protein